MKAYQWDDEMNEKHVVVIAESVEDARERANAFVTTHYSWFIDRVNFLNNEPFEDDLPTVIVWDEAE